MKTRIISALVALLLLVPIFIKGGLIFDITVIILSLLAIKEFMDVKSTKKEVPAVMKIITYILVSLIVLSGTTTNDMIYSVDIRLISALFLIYLIPTVLFHNKNKYSVVDAFYFIGGIFFIGIAFFLLMYARGISLSLVIYLFTISIFTDTFAYITGMLIGKHKLTAVSPKKTIEGTIGGSLMGTILSTVFYITVINSNNILIIIFVTLFLSVLSQFGDLTFSAIKRYYNKKDFSNIMPGHGGVLDRLDSIIFILLGFMFFINIL